MSKLQYLVIHCTATPENRDVKASEIKAWHCSPPPIGRGWKQVGYTDLLHLNGKWERLANNNEDAVVDPWEITNGARGYNGISRHIVYAGGISADGKQTPKDTRTSAQLESLKRYVLDFHQKNPNIRIIGHNEIAHKACPSFDVQEWLKSIGIKQ